MQGSFAIERFAAEGDEERGEYQVRMSLWGVVPFPQHYHMGVIDPKTVVLTRKSCYYKLRHVL